MIPDTSLQAAVTLQKWADPMNQAHEWSLKIARLLLARLEGSDHGHATHDGTLHFAGRIKIAVNLT